MASTILQPGVAGPLCTTSLRSPSCGILNHEKNISQVVTVMQCNKSKLRRGRLFSSPYDRQLYSSHYVRQIRKTPFTLLPPPPPPPPPTPPPPPRPPPPPTTMTTTTTTTGSTALCGPWLPLLNTYLAEISCLLIAFWYLSYLYGYSPRIETGKEYVRHSGFIQQLWNSVHA